MGNPILDLGLSMSAILEVARPSSVNRRRRVRQKVHAPAYVSFTADRETEMLNLYEILDISEVGIAIQGSSQMEVDRQVDLCLDLAEASGSIAATARVVWSDADGRVGFGLPVLPDSSLHRLREWLFLNSMAGVANAAAQPNLAVPSPRPANYTDILTAASAVQTEADSLGADMAAVLDLIASRSHTLFRASGAAIALAGKDIETMTCRASAGETAPPVGAILQAGSGFSGECVRSGETLRCDDAETDPLVDRESCHALGIRSILAAPVLLGEKVIGLLEIFSPRPQAFGERETIVLRRFADSISAAVKRAAPAEETPVAPSQVKPFSPAPGSVLFAHEPEERSEYSAVEEVAADKAAAIHLPRTRLYFLLLLAAIIALALGFLLAPKIQPWIQNKFRVRRQTSDSSVLAASQPKSSSEIHAASTSSADSSNLQQLRTLAQHGDPAAANAIGLLYAVGDESQSIKQDQSEAARWFSQAAENGSVSAQYKLALLYWGGHGVPKDANKAYFWAVLARAGGQEGSKDLAKVLANGMTRAQTVSIEQQAELWYQQHESGKPSPGR
jgi:putative methionine-R-sulfoxide reductase with GAF domain